MKSPLGFTALGLGASASAVVPHVLPQAQGHEMCFTLTAHGPAAAHGMPGPNGIIGQLSDGQNRVGGGLPVGNFCLKDRSFIDKHKRGCILTPPTTQFQCDEGARPTPGFDVGCDGGVTFKGSSTFYGCPVNDHGEWNVYTRPAPGQLKCVQIKLTATPHGGEAPSCRPHPHKPLCGGPHTCERPTPKPSSSPHLPAQPISPTHPVTSTNRSHPCPADLNGPFEFPHLIVQVDSSRPDMRLGNQLNGKVNSSICTIFNFDIDHKDASKTCTLVFLLPYQSQLQTSAYRFKGRGSIQFSHPMTPVTTETTWNSRGDLYPLKSLPIQPGNSYTVYSARCTAGERIAVQMCGQGIDFEWFQDWNESPIGLFMRKC